MSFVKPRPAGFNDGTRLYDTELDSFQDQLVQAVDGYNGGNYPLSADLTFSGSASVVFDGYAEFNSNVILQATSTTEVKSGATVAVEDGATFSFLGTTNLPQIGSRTYAYPQPLLPIPTAAIYTAPVSWIWAPPYGEWVNNNVAGGAWEIDIPLTKLPHLGTLESIRVYISGNSLGGGGGGHTNLPATMPTATLMGRVSNSATAVTVGALVTDNPGSVGNYNGVHVLSATYDAGLTNYTFTGLSEALTSSEHYWLRITGESGANSDDLSLCLLGITCLCTVTEIAPG